RARRARSWPAESRHHQRTGQLRRVARSPRRGLARGHTHRRVPNRRRPHVFPGAAGAAPHDSRSVAGGGQGRGLLDHGARQRAPPGRRHDRHVPPRVRDDRARAVPALARRVAGEHWPHRGPAREAEADRDAGPRQERRALAPLVGTRVGGPVGRYRARRARHPERHRVSPRAAAVQPHRRTRLPLDRPGGRGRPGRRPRAVRDQHRPPLEPQRIPRRRPRHPCPRPDQPGGGGMTDRDELGNEYYELIGPDTLSTTATIEATNGHPVAEPAPVAHETADAPKEGVKEARPAERTSTLPDWADADDNTPVQASRGGEIFFDRRNVLGVDLANAVLGRVPLATDPGGRLYSYSRGVWRLDGERTIRAHVIDLLGNAYRPSHSTLVESIITARKPRISEEMITTRYINVANGLLDWRTGELHPHTPDVISVNQIPVEWDPDADCPHIRSW